ncbi:isochorismate synthase [Sedimenticola sp.]|uniref:isochorismate synthase n=1 Tax=Sedimenticola sp. TaxID=1940285 RepID=UPI003D0BFC65
MPNRPSPIETILDRLDTFLATLPAGSDGLASITLVTPELRLQRLPPLDGSWFYWGEPSRQRYLLGIGEALRLSTCGSERLDRLSDQFEQQRTRWLHLDPDASGFHATAFTGFAFDPDDPMQQSWSGLPNAAIFFPELLLHQTPERCAVTFSFNHRSRRRVRLRSRHLLQELTAALLHEPPLNPGPNRISRTAAMPSYEEWILQVREATQQIRQGSLDKVVPFRRISVRADHPLNPSRLMASLDDLYPSSLLFAIRLDGSTFAAATPERLITRQHHRISCDAIGGTIHRSPERQEDRRLGRQLMNDPKSRHEHDLVVQGILASLAAHCGDLTAPAKPTLKRLRKLQHLWTGISGELQGDATLLKIADALHPTAAVSGFPSANAGRWLSDHQNAARGWYTGAAGWLDRQGDGELAVLLRCALLSGENAELFAGAGVTSESCPIAEFQETELKFGTMLEALEHA